MSVAFCFPGQGSQEVGMGRALAEALPAARAVFDEASEAAGLDLAELCFQGPIEELTRTELQQPALVATSIACLRAVETAGIEPAFVVGHSVGEYSAIVAGGALGIRDGVRLVRERGRATAAAAREHAGVMAAVIGLDDAVVEELCAGIDGVWPANYNCPGQIVVSGTAPAVDQLLRAATERGARRAVKLRITGAFHSPLVASAGESLRASIGEVDWHELRTPLMSTVTARVEESAQLGDLLVEQLTSPVRFTQAVQALVEAGVDLFVEVGPGTVLGGLIRRVDPSVATLSVNDPESLAKLEEVSTA